MSIRDKLNKHQPLVIGIASVAIICGLISTIWQATTSGAGKGQGYFTIDDGKTVFIDSITKPAPFEKDGKQAVRAHVFSCGGKEIVGYMERFTPEAIQMMKDVQEHTKSGKKGPPPNVYKLASIATTGTELKKPGDAKWLNASDPRAMALRGFRCPDGAASKEIDPNSK